MFRSYSASANSAALLDGDSPPERFERANPGEAAGASARAGTLAPDRAAHLAGPLAKQPDWMPRMWQGCGFFTWLALLSRNRFAVHPRYWPIAAVVTVISFTNTLLGLLERAIFGGAVRATRIEAPPIFLIGHWRTGTTLLHELMACDERFACPTTYQCLSSGHFLLTERWLARWLGFLLPASRQMDNMKQSFDRPQEDEFALCMSGAGSPYSAIAFPNRTPRDESYLDLDDLSPARRRRWQKALYGFLQKLTYRHGKRLVLKSPPHTARIKTLREMFPDAIFIHIVRDPYVVFPSTLNLWRTLYRTHGLQVPTYDGIEERVLRTFVRMFEKLEAGRALLRPGQLYELSYEDLIRNPAGEIRKIYDHFQLGGFDDCLPRLKDHLASIGTYETNKYRLTQRERDLISRRWGDVIRRYGYGAAPLAEPCTPHGNPPAREDYTAASL
jgi:hypothetical protein